MRQFLFKNKFLHFTVFVFAFFTLWWVAVQPFDSTTFLESKKDWSSFYWVFAAMGGVFGVYTSRRLGLWHSAMGRVILAFSIGLLLQTLGQVVDSATLLFTNTVSAYPSISEFGYSGSIIAYIYGSYLLAGYVSVRPATLGFTKTAIVWGISLVMFVATYLLYLKDYSFTTGSTLSVIFDFGYPVLESVYVALSVFVLVNSDRIGGGMLKKPITFLVCALMLQYVSDSYFVYEFNNSRWYSGNFNDFCYLLSYFVLTVAIIYFDEVLSRLPVSGDGAKTSFDVESDHNPYADYEALARLIIKSQEDIIGPLAWTAVSQVQSIIVKDKDNMVIEIVGDPKVAINSLLDKYVKVFGPISLNVAKDKTKNILNSMQADMIPERLR